MPEIKGLIFDFDGLILDTETPEYLSWLEIYREHGSHIEPQEWATFLGTKGSVDYSLGLLEQRSHKTVHRQDVEADYHHRANHKILQQPILPGVVDLLEDAVRSGLKLAVASSSPQNWVNQHLQRLKLTHYFDHILCRDDVDQIKPHPELYQAAMQRLGLAPHETIALEDSPNGIRSAVTAGLFCVAVPNPISRQLDLSQANIIVNSLADISLNKLIQLPGNNHHPVETNSGR